MTLLVRRISRLASRRLVAARFFRFSIPTHPFGFGFVSAYDATGYLASAIFVGVLPYQNPLHVASTQIAAAAQHALTHVALEVGVQPLAALEHEVDTAIAHED